MVRRSRNPDPMRQAPKYIRVATGLVIGLGLIALALAFFGSDDSRRARQVRRLSPGLASAAVVDRLGPPPARCPVGELDYLQANFPDEFSPATAGETIARMEAETSERWVYPGRGRTPGCIATNGATEIGLGRDGRILWLVPVTGRTPVRLPDAYRTDLQEPS